MNAALTAPVTLRCSAGRRGHDHSCGSTRSYAIWCSFAGRSDEWLCRLRLPIAGQLERSGQR